MNIEENDILKLEDRFDVYKLINETFSLVEEFPDLEQIGLTHTIDCPKDQVWIQSFGSLYDQEVKRYTYSSSDFCVLNNRLSGTYLDKVYQAIANKYGPIGRVRLMKLLPGRCYKTHLDLEKRIHIAVNTSEQCYFVFENKRIAHIPADGSPYLVNTLIKHTFVNADKFTTRLHIIFEIASS